MARCVSSLWGEYIANEEAAAEAACFGTAERNGHTIEEAEECDDGSVGCPDCPFITKQKESESE